MNKSSRRHFLRTTSYAGLGGLLLPRLWGATSGLPPTSFSDRIGCTTVSFRPRFPETRPNKLELPDDLSAATAAAFMVETLGIQTVELWSQHLATASLEDCQQIRAATAKVGARINNIQLDDWSYNLAGPDAEVRAKGVAFVKSWIRRAAACGGHSMRANVGGGKTPFELARSAAAFTELAEYGQSQNVIVLVENHGGYSADPDNLVALLEAVDHPFCRSLPDFGNMPADIAEADRHAFLAKILPYAHLVSVKAGRFNEDQQHEDYDIGACVRLAEAHGFRGVYSIELWSKDYYPADPVQAALQVGAEITANLSSA